MGRDGRNCPNLEGPQSFNEEPWPLPFHGPHALKPSDRILDSDILGLRFWGSTPELTKCIDVSRSPLEYELIPLYWAARELNPTAFPEGLIVQAFVVIGCPFLPSVLRLESDY